jgi:hypothetical protein
MREQQIMKSIQAVLSARSASTRVFRNNVGRYKDSRGAWLTYGLGVGSADLVGIVAPSGRLFAIEVKTPEGKTTPEQDAWLATIRRFGGVAGVARSVEEAMAIVDEAAAQDVRTALTVLTKLAPHFLHSGISSD